MSKNWPSVSLGEVLEPKTRPETIKAQKTYNILGAHWYAKGLYTKAMLTGSEIRANKVYRIEKDDFVYNRLFGWKGSFAVATEKNHNCYVSNEFPCFLINKERLDKQYLWYYFSRESAWLEALGLSSGGTPTSRNRLKQEKLLAMQIPLPPLDEQRRIVARIEELAAKAEQAQSLRQKSVVEVEAVLPQVIHSLIDQQGFPFISLKDLLRENSRNGLGNRLEDTPPGIPTLRISAATSRTDSIIDESDFKYLEVNDTEFEKYKLEPGDLLACRFNGNLHYVGKFALYQGYSKENRLYPDKLIRFRVDTDKILPEYAVLAMNSPERRKAIEAFCATTAGNIGISATKLKTVPVPVPPLPEQRRIVAYLDNLQAKVEAVKRHQAATAAKLDALLPSILDKAFKGEL
jgi:type I restriction enzyme S subunit